MAMVLNEEQEMLREAAAGFLQEHAPVSQLRRLRDEENIDGFDKESWQSMAEMGWAAVLVPEQYDGVEMGFQAAGLIAEEMGRTLTASPFLTSAMMGVAAISRFGDEEKKNNWLPKLATGEALLTIAVDEGRKHDPQNVTTTALRSGNGFVLNGEKTFVAEASTADGLIVSARTSGEEGDENGITLFLVPNDQKGVSIEKKSMVDSRNFGAVKLDQVEVNADAVLGEVDQGYQPLELILNVGRAGLAAEMMGSAQEATDRTVTYLKEREQFGKIIGEFQALQHRASHLYSEIQLAKSIVMKALQMLDSAPEMSGLMVSAAKAKLGQVAQLATQEAVQMHGGVGMTDEFDIGFFMKRIRVAEALYGDANYHAQKYAKLRGF